VTASAASEKRDIESTTAARLYNVRSGGPEIYDRLHLPARLVPRHGDVASASELPVAGAIA
jgi:hypothetical protein